MKRRTKTGLLLLSLSLAGLLYAHIHFCYNVFLKPARLYAEATKEKPYDAVIIPGIPSDGGQLGFIMKWRVYWSVYIYRKGLAKNIIYSGSAVYTPYTEAIIMAMYAEKMGIPKEHIFVETKAEHTTENLFYSWKIAKEKGFNSVAFATDPFQSMKIEPYIKKFNIDVNLLPMVVSIVENMDLKTDSIESYKAYKLNFISIRDRETEEEQEFYSKGGRIK